MADDILALAKLRRGECLLNRSPRVGACEMHPRFVSPRRISEAL